jgi:hypothetical protein
MTTTPTITLADLRETRPRNRRQLHKWLARHLGVVVPWTPVCEGHSAPLDFVAQWCLDRPQVSLVLGPRGGGKSYLSGVATHFDSRFYPRHQTRILGGSLAQSQQIYDALEAVVLDGHGVLGDDSDSINRLNKQEAVYHNGSKISILAASSKSVRGPHVPTLRLDEVDEIESDIRESAMGMCMARDGMPAMVAMTSTWHKVGGAMDELLQRGRAGEFPSHTFCIFEVLERCPDERSGLGLERCPDCPLRPWCHDDIERTGVPKAKRASGHYAIDSLIQKVRTVSLRILEADYLCLGPKADGVWFRAFDRARHVSELSEYDPALPVSVAVDSGVFTGAVFFQVRESHEGLHEVNVFADYLAEGVPAESNALALLDMAQLRCNGNVTRWVTDPAGASRTAIGPTVLAEYQRAGLRNLTCWPNRSGTVLDGLALIEGFLAPADGKTRLRVHPRCEDTIKAFQNYKRKRRGDQWTDDPEDPQHPWEDLMDSLRGGLLERFPDGRRPQSKMARVPGRSLV